jgi:hypothetical protein
MRRSGSEPGCREPGDGRTAPEDRPILPSRGGARRPGPRPRHRRAGTVRNFPTCVPPKSPEFSRPIPSRDLTTLNGVPLARRIGSALPSTCSAERGVAERLQLPSLIRRGPGAQRLGAPGNAVAQPRQSRVELRPERIGRCARSHSVTPSSLSRSRCGRRRSSRGWQARSAWVCWAC